MEVSMFNAAEKAALISALEDKIASASRAQKAGRFPDMAPVFEKAISDLRSLIVKVQNAKGG